MNFSWNLTEQQPSLVSVHATRRQEKVLLEYDGPALVTLSDGHNHFIGLAVDEDDSEGIVRWLQVPVTALELRAVIQGAESLRQIFLKDRVSIVDYGRSHVPLRVWDVPSGVVPSDALPDPGVFFPGTQKRLATLTQERPTFSLAGRDSPDRVTFGELSAVTSTLQGLWGAIAQTLQAKPLTLAASSFAEGSLKVVVHTDDPILFERAAKVYRDLVMASENRETLRSALAPLPLKIATSYKDYLQALRQHGVEVLAEWNYSSAFVGHATASRARTNYPATKDISPILTSEETVTRRGVFQGFIRSKKMRNFEFYELDSAKWFEGRLAKSVLDTLPPEFDLFLGRGFPKRYLATIRTRRTGEQESHTLVAYTEDREATSLSTQVGDTPAAAPAPSE